MSITDARTTAYYELFRASQMGGTLPVYQGYPRYQSGQGFGDFFRGLFRRIIPVGLNVAKTFLGALGSSSDQGASPAEALKAAIRPTITTALKSGVEQIGQYQDQRNLEEAQRRQDKQLKKLAAMDQSPAASIPPTVTESALRSSGNAPPSIEMSGSGRRRHKRVYKHKRSGRKSKRISYNF